MLPVGVGPSARKHAWQVDMVNVVTINVLVHMVSPAITLPGNAPAHPVSLAPAVSTFAPMEDMATIARVHVLVESTLNVTQEMENVTVLLDSRVKDAGKNVSKVRTALTASWNVPVKTEEAAWHLMDLVHALPDTLVQLAMKHVHKVSMVSSAHLYANVDPVENATTSLENASRRKPVLQEKLAIAAYQIALQVNGVKAVTTPVNAKIMASATLFQETVLAD